MLSTDDKSTDMNADDDTQSALTLIKNQKTMVLATCQQTRPWSAPVYYVYVPPGFFFFSSRRSRHIRQAQPHQRIAAAIFCDDEQWQNIQGVQMTGHVQQIQASSDLMGITGRYLAKFPFARRFLSDGGKKILDMRDNVRLYGFYPLEIHYVNNRMEFGRRVLLESLTPDQKEP